MHTQNRFNMDSDTELERPRYSSISSFATYDSVKIRKHFKPWVLHKFVSNWEYILISLGCTFTIHNFFALNVRNTERDTPTMIHFVVCYTTIALPLTYMQTLIGQYSQVGVILFKHMCPIGHGVGYALLLNSIMWCCYFGTVMADFFMYFLACIATVLNWMVCPIDSEDRCWDSNSNCTKSCISKEIHVSSYIYWREKYMHNVDLDPPRLVLGTPMVARFVPVFITWVLVYIIVSMGIDKYKKIVRINIFLYLTLIVVLMLLCFVTSGSGKGLGLLFRINPRSLLSLAAWSRAIHHTLKATAVSRACHMTFGTYMTPSMPSDILSIFSVLINFVVTLMGTMITNAILGIIMVAAGIEEQELSHVWKNGTSPYFTVLIQGIGFMGVPQLWTMIYFLTFMLIIVNNLVTQIDIIERSIADAHSKIRAYRNYMLATICIVCAIFGFIASSKEFYIIGEHLYRRVMPEIHSFDVTFMCILAFWIYRVQRICDDIHFMQGFQPTKFWKIYWYMLPCSVGFSFLYYTFIKPVYWNEIYSAVHITGYILLISPIPILMIVEVFRYLRIHNLIGLMQPEERWGPPDPQERYLRLLFNPRQEIRSRRRDDTCQHKCLLGSKIIRKLVTEEKTLREVHRVNNTEIENEDTSTSSGGGLDQSSSSESV